MIEPAEVADATPTTGEPLMTIQEVATHIGGARPPTSTTIYRWVKLNGFPRPIKLSHRCARWRKSEVEAWLLTRRQ
jgi:predicted DNA-binding transcriptional regulator AlpA